MAGNFSDQGFIRTGGGVSYEERGAQPSDFTERRGYKYAGIYAENPDLFSTYYPDWQTFADCFTVRRAIISVSGKQECLTSSFKASDLMQYTGTGFQKVKNMKLPGSDRSSIPGGKYQLTGFSFSDGQNGITVVNISYQQYGEWELIQIQEKLPSPGKGPPQ